MQTKYRSTILALMVITLMIFNMSCTGGSSGGDSSVGSGSGDNSETPATGTANAAPTAEAGGPYVADVGETTTLSAANSSDTDGTITKYAWDLDNDGQYDDSTGMTVSYTPSSSGTFSVGLQVTDDQGDTDTDMAWVTVSDEVEDYAGYNLFSSLNSTTAYLMDMDGNFVHSWPASYAPGNAMYLLENGELLRTGKVNNTFFDAGGAGGIVQTLDWDGNVTWEYEYSSSAYLQHHDVEMLPNGNVLMVAWQYKSEDEALAAGRNPALLSDGELWPDSVIEVQPTGPNSGQIVWEWHVWDHLVQDYDAAKDNYGVVADHPELVDLNFTLQPNADWNHINAVDYNADLDQIVLTVHDFSEIWVIDHSTTTAEAASHSGGNSGRGGDIMYRWGNPQAYGAGTANDQQLFVPHDAEWIEAGYPGEGNILIFNNGGNRPDGNYSTVEEIIPPLNPDGGYALAAGSAYGPASPTWMYKADTPTDFYAQNISGQQRLPNGNTLICDGPSSYFFEVTQSGEIVWEYDYSGAVFRVERYPATYAGFNGTLLGQDPSNEAPTADAGGPYYGTVGDIISLDGSGSFDTDGFITLYEWDLDNDGQYDDALGTTANFDGTTSGTFSISLRVTDNDGITDVEYTLVTITSGATGALTYPVVDTGQTEFFGNTASIAEPSKGDAFYGQDAHYEGNQPSYTDNGDGTVTDLVTGLLWQQGYSSAKLTYSEALAYVNTVNNQALAGYTDWRLPSIKELYSLMDFRGTDPAVEANDTSDLIPYVDTAYFDFEYGDTSAGERVIDSQWATTSLYVADNDLMFGVNFADGRIKGYGMTSPNPMVGEKTFFVRLCRGNTEYGINDFVSNGNGTVTDQATGLMWTQSDNGAGLDWESALAWVAQKNADNYLGYSDWRMPNAKELQSIVDYTSSPDTTNSAAIDALFSTTTIINVAGETDYPFFWTGTTHFSANGSGSRAVYLCFGRGLGYMNNTFVDIHGAGCQRSDPKTGDPDDFPSWGNGPQGDIQRVFNYVRMVRDE